MRGQPMNPRLVMDFESVPEEVQFLSGNGWQWLFIDTPPAGMDLIEQSVGCINQRRITDLLAQYP